MFYLLLTSSCKFFVHSLTEKRILIDFLGWNKNNIKIPKKMLRSDHIIAKSTGSTYWISFMINKEVFNGDEKNLIEN